MGYVIAGFLVLAFVAVLITLLVRGSRQDHAASAADSHYGEGKPGSDLSIIASDDSTPLGDTDQHADAAEGTPVSRR